MTSKHAVSSWILAKLSATGRPLVKGTQELTPEEIDLVFGGKSLANKAIQGCVNGASAGASTAADGYGLLGAGAGCFAGASAAMAGEDPPLKPQQAGSRAQGSVPTRVPPRMSPRPTTKIRWTARAAAVG